MSQTTTKPTNTVSPVSELMTRVQENKSQRQQTIADLQAAKEAATKQLTEIDNLLNDMMGNPVQVAQTNVAANSTKTKPGAVGRGAGPRGSNTVTVAGGVEQLLRRYKKGLSRAEVTVKMAQEIGYKASNGEEKAYANNIYTGGIIKLQGEGKVISVGQRPNTVYKHVDHSTADEIAAFKASRGK